MLSVKNKEAALIYINDLLERYDFQTNSIEATYQSDNLFDINIKASTLHEFDKMELANKFYQSDNIISVKI